ncbi:MAG: twin-arginine translocase TatA/TatE family subunit [Bacteroidales bacterium]|nr:twin-arginine translocase TatA/TatE family subunit [Bacteroidales bacterium]
MKALFIYPLAIQGWEWIILLVLVLLLFGGKKIPELMKGVGKGVKSFKEGMKEVEKDVDDIRKDIETSDDKKEPEAK